MTIIKAGLISITGANVTHFIPYCHPAKADYMINLFVEIELFTQNSLLRRDACHV